VSTLSEQLISIISTRASSQGADPELDLTIEMLRRHRDLTEVLLRKDQLIEQHGSAEKALAVLEHEFEASGRSE
jgi:hypothetical protein